MFFLPIFNRLNRLLLVNEATINITVFNSLQYSKSDKQNHKKHTHTYIILI